MVALKCTVFWEKLGKSVRKFCRLCGILGGRMLERASWKGGLRRTRAMWWFSCGSVFVLSQKWWMEDWRSVGKGWECGTHRILKNKKRIKTQYFKGYCTQIWVKHKTFAMSTSGVHETQQCLVGHVFCPKNNLIVQNHTTQIRIKSHFVVSFLGLNVSCFWER